MTKKRGLAMWTAITVIVGLALIGTRHWIGHSPNASLFFGQYGLPISFLTKGELIQENTRRNWMGDGYDFCCFALPEQVVEGLEKSVQTDNRWRALPFPSGTYEVLEDMYQTLFLEQGISAELVDEMRNESIGYWLLQDDTKGRFSTKRETKYVDEPHVYGLPKNYTLLIFFPEEKVLLFLESDS